MMEEQALGLSDHIGALKRRRLSILVIAVTIFVVGAMAALLWPPTYKSSATILIKEQDIPADLVRTTVTSFASQRIQAISQKVMARPNLMEIIDKYKLYEKERKRLTTEQIIGRMRANINLDMIQASVVDPRSGRPTTATIAFQLSFSGEHPNQVHKVANELMSLYLKENLKERSEQATETLAFLTEESTRIKREILKLEEKLAAFKEKHAKEMPGTAEVVIKVMERTEDTITDADRQIRSLEEKKDYLENQLMLLKPYGDNISLDPVARLKAMRNEYLRLIARYSENHPDVIRAKREIKVLEQETGTVDSSTEKLEKLEKLDALRIDLARLRETYSDEHPDVINLQKQIKTLQAPGQETPSSAETITVADGSANNPAYIQIQTQIKSTDLEIKELRIKQAVLRDKLATYEQRIAGGPQLEWEYRELTRELSSALQRHQQIRAKQMQAEIAQQLEKDSKGERFVIIEPPILPEKPVSPNRPAILFFSIVLALGCGIGYAAIRESLEDTIRGSKSLSFAVGAEPLAIIPYLPNDAEVRRHKRTFATRASAAAAAVVLAIAMLHYFWTPLDVLWYKALRKADIVVNT